MSLAVVAAVFPVIFVAELPDKTMLASLLLASRGHPRAVRAGAATAFLVHVVIATTAGVTLFAVLPGQVVDVVAGAMFLAGGTYALMEAGRVDAGPDVGATASRHHIMTAAFLVVFVAEWGDLTQIMTANLAARYHSALGVGLGAVLALWAVAGLAVLGGRGLLRHVPVAVVRRVTGGVLLVLSGVAFWAAIPH